MFEVPLGRGLEKVSLPAGPGSLSHGASEIGKQVVSLEAERGCWVVLHKTPPSVK